MTKILTLMAAHGHPDDQEVALLRIAELCKACEITGTAGLALLGYHDSRMPGQDYRDWR